VIKLNVTDKECMGNLNEQTQSAWKWT